VSLEKNKERNKEYNKAYYLKNREKLLAVHAEYRKTHWDSIYAHKQLVRDKWFKELLAKRQSRIEARVKSRENKPTSLT
jgi:hypothetical protein